MIVLTEMTDSIDIYNLRLPCKITDTSIMSEKTLNMVNPAEPTLEFYGIGFARKLVCQVTYISTYCNPKHITQFWKIKGLSDSRVCYKNSRWYLNEIAAHSWTEKCALCMIRLLAKFSKLAGLGLTGVLSSHTDLSVRERSLTLRKPVHSYIILLDGNLLLFRKTEN